MAAGSLRQSRPHPIYSLRRTLETSAAGAIGQMVDKAALPQNSAKNNGRNFNSHRSRYLCSKCHTPQIIGQKETTWMAPEAKFDYTGFDARSTCEMAKRNLGNDSNRIREHLLHDGRVRWAIESGMTPSRQKAAVPGGYAEWERDVLAWVSGGMRCE